jgi:hypothetical protein
MNDFNRAIIQSKQQFFREFIDLSAMFDHQWSRDLTTDQIEEIITGLDLTPDQLMLLPLSVAETLVEHGLLLDIAASREYLASQGLTYSTRQGYNTLMESRRANQMTDWIMLGNRKFFLASWWDEWLAREKALREARGWGRAIEADTELKKMHHEAMADRIPEDEGCVCEADDGRYGPHHDEDCPRWMPF